MTRLLAFFLACVLCCTATLAANATENSRPNLVMMRQNPLCTIGVNYGRVADNLPPPKQAVALMRKMGVGSVRIFDADPEVLSALAHTGLRVVITVKNQDIPAVASSQQAADDWVQRNVLPFYPAAHINIVDVGNELLSDSSNKALWQQLVPAMRNVYASLAKVGLAGQYHIKVTTSSAMDILGSSFPPSAGAFRDDIATSVMQPLLQFLSDTKSPFFLNVYPYLTWSADPQQIPLDYAVFGAGGSTTDGAGPGSSAAATTVIDGGLKYDNLLDAQLDAVWAAMAKLGFSQVELVISETGWPTRGDPNQPGADTVLAASYNHRLVNKMLAWPPRGTPLRPGTFIPTFIFALFNENLKPGPTTERNWGLLYPNGTRVYEVDLTDRLVKADNHTPVCQPPPSTPSPSSPPPTSTPSPASPPPPSTPSPASPPPPTATPAKSWCVAKPTADPAALQQALDFACGANTVFCEAIQLGQPCFEPNTLQSHASYAFNAYWQTLKTDGATCNFNGNAVVTITDPSYNACNYTSV